VYWHFTRGEVAVTLFAACYRNRSKAPAPVTHLAPLILMILCRASTLLDSLLEWTVVLLTQTHSSYSDGVVWR